MKKTTFEMVDDIQFDIYERCPTCQSVKLERINHNIVHCENCDKKFLIRKKCRLSSELYEEQFGAKNVEDKSAVPNVNTSDIKTFKTYTLRGGVKKTNHEPEVIEILSSDEEPPKPKPNEDTKNLEPIHSNQEYLIDGPQTIYSFEEWDIKESDFVNASKESIDTESDDILIDLKGFRMGGYYNTAGLDGSEDSDKITVNFLSKDAYEINFDLKESENKIGILCAMDDVKYCAAIFHDPFYFLCLKVDESTCKLYLNELNELPSFNKKDPFLMNKLNSSRIFLVLDIKKKQAANTRSKLESFFKKSKTNKLGFLNRKKSYELMKTCFRDEAILLDVVKYFKKTQLHYESFKLKYSGNDQSESVDLVSNDLLCLNDGEFLNDVIISFYLKYIYNNLCEKDRERTYIFDTFFYQKLTQKSNKLKANEKISAAERRYLRVKNWTRNVNIFEKDFLIIPINKQFHWYVAIVCFPYLSEPVYDNSNLASTQSSYAGSYQTSEQIIPEPDVKQIKVRKVFKSNTSALTFDSDSNDEEDIDEADSNPSSSQIDNSNKRCLKRPVILIFDSMQKTSGRGRVITTLKEYLDCEWAAKYEKNNVKMESKRAIPGSIVEVPAQTNHFDCGIYLLHNVQCFFEKPLENFNLPIDLSNWFTRADIDCKRRNIFEILLLLYKNQKTSTNPTILEAQSEIKDEAIGIETKIMHKGKTEIRTKLLSENENMDFNDVIEPIENMDTQTEYNNCEASSNQTTKIDLLDDMDYLIH